MTKLEFQKACLEAGIQLNEEQMNQFEKYMHLLVEWNEKMNLTAITQEEEVWEKHFYDSIMPFSNIDFELLKGFSIVFITIILSFFTLVFGELVPKRLAMKYYEKIAFATISHPFALIFLARFRLFSASSTFV